LKEDAIDYAMLLMWGSLVAAYVQTLFLNGNMEAIMGHQTDYSERTAGNIINLFIWAVIILIPLCVFIFFKIKKKSFHYEKAFVFSLVILSGMQIAGLVSTALTTELPEGYDQEPVYFTHNAAVNFNSDENIVVFVIDTFDVILVRHALELNPHLWEYFTGFTYYEDNTSEYFDTVASVTSMLTQHHILPWESGWTYIDRAWDRHTMIDTLRDNGYSTNLFLDRTCSFGKYENIRGRTDNTIVADRLNIHFRHFIPVTTRLSLGRLSPYFLKNTWLSTIGPDFSNAFFFLDAENDDSTFIPVVSRYSDMRFYRYIKEAEFSADRDENFFMFMHINGPHSYGDRNDPGSWGFHYDEVSGQMRYGGDMYDIIHACFEMLNLYFNKMKEIGVYDNSTIIILGDHGLRWRYPETTALLIKPKGSTGALTLDTTTSLSNKYFTSSILEAAGLPNGEFGVSHFDIIDGAAPASPKRIIYVKGLNSTTPNGRVYGDYGVWEIVGDANAKESWTFVPRDPLDFFP